VKKILITYATAGIGHKKAATALKKTFDEMSPKNTEVILIDSLNYAPPSFKKSYLAVYLLAVNKLSAIWGFMYYLTDNFYINLIVSKLRRFNNWLNGKRFVEYLEELRPDVIISTHFFASEVVGNLKKKGRLNSRLITVVTDYRLHSWWVAPCTDIYTVYTEDAKADLMNWGIPPDKIRVLGIPVEPDFSRRQEKDRIRAKMNLKKEMFTVLLVGGGFGVGPIEEIVRSIAAITKPIQVIVVCGHNEELVDKIKKVSTASKAHMVILGYVDNVYELMEVSDVLISKSGGMTVSESLAKELPLLTISPIPGQETKNFDFLIKEKAALKIKKPSEVGRMLEDLISNPDKLARIKDSVKRIRKPDAAKDIAELAITL
jgi:processive 1,2-diacylglycerol beta-glucosyltransferase